MIQCVDLFSGAASGTDAFNEPHDFRNPLPQHVDLTGWEVTVKEISLPATWDVVQQPFQWVMERLPIQRTASDVVLDRRIHEVARPFDHYDYFHLDDHVTWVGATGTRLLFTLKRGTYDTGEDVMLQMLRQIQAVYPKSKALPPALELVKNNLGHGFIVERGRSTVAIYVNQALERVLEFADRDPDGAVYKRYALLKHSDYPKGVFVLSWTNYFNPKDVDMLAGEGALFRCITQTHRPHPGYERIQPLDGCHLGKLYYTTTNPPLYHVTTGGVPDTAHQTARFYVYSDFTETRMGGSAGQPHKPLLASVWNPGPPKDYGDLLSTSTEHALCAHQSRYAEPFACVDRR